jgi:hypothetical protein
MKTSELTGVALDWAVAKCEGATDYYFDTVATHWVKLDGKDRALRYGWAQSYQPSTDWAQGGPIIEREKIGSLHEARGVWSASTKWDDPDMVFYGKTKLIAAMRCYVASKLGNDIDVPKDLK